jgi:hypothetical protein
MSTLPMKLETPASAPDPVSSTSEIHQPANSKPRRLLACVLCQQRKVKCDHNYPCATCVKARVPCVQTIQAPRRRRRQFPERELLLHLRQCEDLLSQHNIKFKPLRPNPYSAEDKNSSTASAGKASYESDEGELGKSTTTVDGNVQSGTTALNPERTQVYGPKYALSENRSMCHHRSLMCSRRMFHVMREEVNPLLCPTGSCCINLLTHG